MVIELVIVTLVSSIGGLWIWHTVHYETKGHACITLRSLMVSIGLLSTLLWFAIPIHPQALCTISLLWVLTALSLIDQVAFRLPDRLTQPVLWIGLLTTDLWPRIDIEAAVYGAAAGYSVLWAINALWHGVTQRAGIGQGDMKLAAALGAWLGIDAIPSLISWSAWIAMGAVASVRLTSQHTNHTIAFGPYLSMSGMALLLYL